MDRTAHGYLVAFVRSREDSGESHRWELERDPDPTGAGGIPEEDRIHRAALGSRFLGLMIEDTNEAGVVSDQSLKILPPPRGLTIKDKNQYTDTEDLVSLLQSNVIRTAGFDHLELMLTQAVLVTIPNLLKGVTTVCGRLREIRVLVVKLPQARSTSSNLGLGCHIPNLLWDFRDNRFPARLDILPEDYDNLHNAYSGRLHSQVDRRVLGSGRWYPYHHHLCLGRGVPSVEYVMSLTLTRL